MEHSDRRVVEDVRFEPAGANRAEVAFRVGEAIPDSRLLARTIAAAIEREARSRSITAKPRVATRKLERGADGWYRAPLKGVSATEIGALGLAQDPIRDAVNELAGDIVGRFGLS